MAGYTQFGRLLRQIRLDNNEVLRDMAIRMNVSSSFLSSIEIGKKNVPDTFIDKLCSRYDLTADMRNDLEFAAAESVTAVKINLMNASENKRQVALIFARDFDSVPEGIANELIKLINKGKEG